jgi:hypothetical protein
VHVAVLACHHVGGFAAVHRYAQAFADFFQEFGTAIFMAVPRQLGPWVWAVVPGSLVLAVVPGVGHGRV